MKEKNLNLCDIQITNNKNKKVFVSMKETRKAKSYFVLNKGHVLLHFFWFFFFFCWIFIVYHFRFCCCILCVIKFRVEKFCCSRMNMNIFVRIHVCTYIHGLICMYVCIYVLLLHAAFFHNFVIMQW